MKVKYYKKFKREKAVKNVDQEIFEYFFGLCYKIAWDNQLLS